MMTIHWVSQAVRAVADLSLADHLAGARLTAAEVAEREGSAPTTTCRLMRACVAIGLLTADANGRFGSTPLLQTLRKDTRGSLRDLALAMTQPSQWLPNVAAMPEVAIHVGEQTLTAKPTILREGPEWDRLHAAAVDYWPDILEYQTHTTRTFPFIVLDPIPDPARPR